MDLIDLKAEIRNTRGKGPAHQLRRAGKIPAVLYGQRAEAIPLSVDAGSVENKIKKGSGSHVIITLSVNDPNIGSPTVMLKEPQFHPLTGKLLHLDFYEFASDKKIKIMVPVVTKGKAAGVELGGVLQVVRRDLELLCLPLEVPEAIEIDITDLNIGDSVHIDEISMKEGIEIPADVNFTVLTILAPKKEEKEEVAPEEDEELEEETSQSADGPEEDAKK